MEDWEQLQGIVRDAIRDVLDMNLFAEQQRKESEEARYVIAYQKQVSEALKNCLFVGGDK